MTRKYRPSRQPYPLMQRIEAADQIRRDNAELLAKPPESLTAEEREKLQEIRKQLQPIGNAWRKPRAIGRI